MVKRTSEGGKHRDDASRTTRLHKSFKRSYREDYRRELELPSITAQVFKSFQVIFKNWRIFLPLLLIAVVLSLLLVGVDESASYSGTAMTFRILIFLMVFLVTIFILRRRLTGREVGLREALYNAMTPLLSTLVVFLVAAVQSIPIILLIIGYSAAVQTDFLKMPFYALLFLVFAALMILLSGYLLSSSLIALVAVSAPGLYPLKALRSASDLMAGRRMKFIYRLIALIIVMILVWVIIMLPMISFEAFMKQFAWAAGIPFVQICLTVVIGFIEIYVTTYLYIYYRYLLKFDSKSEK